MSIFDGIEGITEEQKAEIEKNIGKNYVSSEEFERVSSKSAELLSETKKAKQEKREAEEAKEKERLEKEARSGDIEGLKNSYEEKIASLNETISGFQSKENTRVVEDVASAFVKKNVVNDPFIQRSMTEAFSKRVDVREGNPVVLDAKGNLTALSIEDLQSEFLQNSDYKSHLIGSDASGGGAASGSGGSASGKAPKTLKDCETPEERRQVIRQRIEAG
jgi:hypothetical protein